jgi:nickel-dependent lactate racemase
MPSVLRYGADSSVAFDLPSDVLLTECDAPRGQPLDDPAAAVAAALADPIEFPPLAQAIVPGDLVALAVEPGLPQAANIVAAVIQTLVEAGVSANRIAVVVAADDDPGEKLSAELKGEVSWFRHDSQDRDALTYVTTLAAGPPVFLNRALSDADMVIPIGTLRQEASLGNLGAHGVLFPTFCDDATQKRFRAASSVESEVQWKRKRGEAREASQLLGAVFTIQVVPAAKGELLHVLAGEIGAVDAEGRRLCEAAWTYSIPRRGSLVIASIEGDQQDQTWENVGRAIATAMQLVAFEGSIAICSELDSELGPSLQRVMAADGDDAVMQEIRRDRSADAVPASQLVQALRRAHVYLLSRLDDDVVEQLGMAPVADADEIARLASRHDSCILLANAHRTVAHSEEDLADDEMDDDEMDDDEMDDHETDDHETDDDDANDGPLDE